MKIDVKHLSKESRRLFNAISKDYSLDCAGQVILRTGLEAMDRLQEIRQIIAKEGAIYKTNTGYIRDNPALKIEKEARAGFIASFRLLNLEPEDICQPKDILERSFK